MANQAQDLNEQRLEELQGKVLADVAGSMGLIMAYMGDRLNLYSALVEISPPPSECASAAPRPRHALKHRPPPASL